MYVTRRRNRVLRKVSQPLFDPAKSNPSKRHREKLNGELESLANLLPFEESVIVKLDKLSVLRLVVSYLRAKSYYRAVTPLTQPVYPSACNTMFDVDDQLRALNGFIMIIDPKSEVFYVSESVEQYLGFHQSDLLHQNVLELVHSEDRESLSQQLNWNNLLMHLGPTPSLADVNRLQAIGGGAHQLLQKSFVVRFRCLLDNTSGFITMEICGHLKPLYGQTDLSGLSLFAVCTPFGPVPLAEYSPEDLSFRTKHKLDMTIMSLDSRGKLLLGELENTNIYIIIHPMDLRYFSDAHKELLKTGSTGLIAYRLIGKDNQPLWLQTSARVLYRNSRPDSILCYHTKLTEEEGTSLIGKRNIEFTMPHLHSNVLLDDSELGDGMCRPTKVRKPRKSSSTNQSMSEIPANEVINKCEQVYSPFQALQSYSAYTTQLYDTSYWTPQARSAQLDYFSYPAGSFHGNLMNTERLAAVGNSELNYNSHSAIGERVYSPSHNNNCNSVPSLPCNYINNYSAGVFRTDVNSNPLLTLRDIPYPLLYQ